MTRRAAQAPKHPSRPPVHYGRGGALTGPDKEHAETSMLAAALLLMRDIPIPRPKGLSCRMCGCPDQP